MYSTGNRAVKELILMTQGHEQWWEGCLGVGGAELGGGDCDNCNSIINKIYFFKKVIPGHMGYFFFLDK